MNKFAIGTGIAGISIAILPRIIFAVFPPQDLFTPLRNIFIEYAYGVIGGILGGIALVIFSVSSLREHRK